MSAFAHKGDVQAKGIINLGAAANGQKQPLEPSPLAKLRKVLSPVPSTPLAMPRFLMM